jgi:hypothetical protein
MVLFDLTNHFNYLTLIKLADSADRPVISLLWDSGRVYAINDKQLLVPLRTVTTGETWTYGVVFDDDAKTYDLYGWEWYNGTQDLRWIYYSAPYSYKTGGAPREVAVSLGSSLCNVSSQCSSGVEYGFTDTTNWTSWNRSVAISGSCKNQTAPGLAGVNPYYLNLTQWVRPYWDALAYGGAGRYKDNSSYFGVCDNYITLDNLEVYDYTLNATFLVTANTTNTTSKWPDTVNQIWGPTAWETGGFDECRKETQQNAYQKCVWGKMLNLFFDGLKGLFTSSKTVWYVFLGIFLLILVGYIYLVFKRRG